MLTPDQLLASFIFILGLGAGLAALFPPFGGLILWIWQYLRKLKNGPLIEIKVGNSRK